MQAHQQTHWRLAFMLDAPQGDLTWLESKLRSVNPQLQAAVGSHPLRLGILDMDEDSGAGTDDGDLAAARMREMREQTRGVDGAVEITLPNETADDIPSLCRALRPMLEDLAVPGSIEITAGPIFAMIAPRPGSTFLSMAFRRFPGTTSPDFQRWWIRRHAPMVIPVMGPQMLAYDQVHVDEAATRLAAEASGVAYVPYDAYDNLTWADRTGFVDSCSRDPSGMTEVMDDEVGRIDNDSRRRGIMRALICAA